MTSNLLKTFLCFFAILFAVSCEKPVIGADGEEEENKSAADGKVYVRFSLNSPENSGFTNSANSTRATKDVSEVCSRIDCAFYKDDTVYSKASQTSDNANFGSISVALDEGTYTVLFIAHNGLGNATLTNPEKVTFKDNKVTDTFYYYGEITVEGEQDYEITLKRAVAMFRLVVNDNTPSSVSQMKFYYTGGSSTFNAATGYGCVDSRQTELRDVESPAYSSPSKYEVYTFPHSDGKKLKMKVSALSSSGETELERMFENVPVAINEITQYSGNFFEGSAEGGSVKMYVNDEWTQSDYSY